jgi:hypothetical protein
MQWTLPLGKNQEIPFFFLKVKKENIFDLDNYRFNLCRNRLPNENGAWRRFFEVACMLDWCLSGLGVILAPTSS